MNTIPRILRLSGSQPYNHTPDKNFLMIGERTNVAGSPAFAKLIRAGKLEDALEVARQQVENGANVIDICFDDGLIDGKAMMARFLQLLQSEPDIAKVPIILAGQGHRQLDLAQRRRRKIQRLRAAHQEIWRRRSRHGIR
jgi:5-methyltetrahydrofolate--homocysteine methyltransferase